MTDLGRELRGAELIRLDVDELADRYDVVESTIRSHRRRRAAADARYHRRRARAWEAVTVLMVAAGVYLAAGGPAWPH